MTILQWLYTWALARRLGVKHQIILDSHRTLAAGMAATTLQYRAMLRTAAEIEALEEVQR